MRLACLGCECAAQPGVSCGVCQKCRACALRPPSAAGEWENGRYSGSLPCARGHEVLCPFGGRHTARRRLRRAVCEGVGSRQTTRAGCDGAALRTQSPLLPHLAGAVRWWGTAVGSAPECGVPAPSVTSGCVCSRAPLELHSSSKRQKQDSGRRRSTFVQLDQVGVYYLMLTHAPCWCSDTDISFAAHAVKKTAKACRRELE